MNTIQSLFINSSTIVAYLCVLSFLLLVFIGINALLWAFITTAFSEIKLMIINNKDRKKDN
jgi:hypothetical protein